MAAKVGPAGPNGIWILNHVNYPGGDACLIWPFGRDSKGYGNVKWDGKTKRVHRIMCVLVNGPPPTPKHEAAHSCGRGHDACIHPKHLSWKTSAQNQKDRKKHGTSATNPYGNVSRRSPEQNEEIRRAVRNDTVTAVAARFNVSRRTVERIRAGANPRTPSKDPKNVRRRKFA